MTRLARTTLVAAAALIAAAAPANARLLGQVEPVKYNLTVKPGETVTRDVLIGNQGDAPVVVDVHYSDWTLNEEGEIRLLPPGTCVTSLNGLVQFEPAQFSLGPGETGRIHLTLHMPEDGPATRWGVLLSAIRPADPEKSRLGPRAVGELGTTLYLSRVPMDQVHADFTRLDVIPLGTDSISVSVRISNPGERHLYVSGTVAVKDSSGTIVGSGPLPNGVVLPGGARNFTWMCNGALAPGRYVVTATVDTGEHELLVGETELAWPPALAAGIRRPSR